MYPFLRMFKEMARASRMPPLGLFDTHVSHHLCWPWDLDPWVELNNGRTLTLYDLGRLPLGARTGIHRVLKAKGWGMTVAGSSVRYRRRVTVFSRLATYSRCLGWDDRFLYMEQSMWKGGDCASQGLIRSAIVGKSGIVRINAVRSALSVMRRSLAPAWQDGRASEVTALVRNILGWAAPAGLAGPAPGGATTSPPWPLHRRASR